MEPMALGSPSSPLGHHQVHPLHHSTTPQPNRGFLPGYLMGSNENAGTPGTPGNGNARMISPSKLNRSISAQNAPTPTTPLPGRLNNNGGFLTPTTPGLRNNLIRTPSEKQTGGPPITGLYGSSTPNNRSLIVNGGTPYGTPSRLAGTPGGVYGTPVPTTPQLSFGATPNSHNVSHVREEIPYQVGCESTTWITVFGFPPSASGYVLSQFSQYGSVLQHHSPPNGNWMHIRYQTKIQAQKALAKGGKILGGSIMIGVSPCTDTAFMEESIAQQEMLNGSQLNASHVLDASQINSSNLNRSSIRPMTQAYKTAQSEHDVLANPNTPDKADGFVTKAMEYIFGW